MGAKPLTDYRMSPSALARLLRSVLGEEKATEVVDSAIRDLSLPAGSSLGQDDALKALDLIAKTPGIVGITARFAMSHVHLHWGEER